MENPFKYPKKRIILIVLIIGAVLVAAFSFWIKNAGLIRREYEWSEKYNRYMDRNVYGPNSPYPAWVKFTNTINIKNPFDFLVDMFKKEDTEKVQSPIQQETDQSTQSTKQTTDNKKEENPFKKFSISDEAKAGGPVEEFLYFRNYMLMDFDWSVWNWQNDYVYVGIKEFYPNESSILVYPVSPKKMRFTADGNISPDNPYTKVKVSCTPDQTILMRTDLSEAKRNLNLFALPKIEAGYKMYTKCLNEKCSELGKICAPVDLTRLGHP